MQVIESRQQAMALQIAGAALTMGSFDGVHRGHQFLIEQLRAQAAGRPTVVVTFHPHPAKILSKAPSPLIFDREDQIQQFSQLGVDYLYFVNFDSQLAQLSAEQFAEEHLAQTFQPKVIVIGHDFEFGKNREGNFAFMQDYARAREIHLARVEPFRDQGEIISSTLIRKNLFSGNVARASELLGRPFYLRGEIIRGRQLGRTLGIPTANLLCRTEVIPQAGVYACTLPLQGQVYRAVTNVGINPTVSQNDQIKVECHILDFDGDLYGQTLCLQFRDRIRDEKKFPNLEALKAQIQIDILAVRTRHGD